VFRSIDVPQTTDQCAGSMDEWWRTAGGNHTATPQATSIDAGFEGIRIIDITNPSSPVFVKGVATDCGSYTHTIVPDLANNRVLLYVSSFPNSGLSNVATSFGNTCEQSGGGHDKISIVAVPLGAPATASVIAEVPLGLKGYNSFFSYIPGYTGDFNNMPGYKGCHDIAVSMPTKTAAAACVTEGITLDITNPAAPTVKDHFVNPYTDLCATGVYRWTPTQGTTATTPNCMWNSATFTYDGKRVIWGELSSGTGGCSSNATGSAQSCNDGGNTNAGVDRFYDGTAVTNECDIGGGGANRDPFVRGAFWMFDINDPSFPISSFKTPRQERYSNQGCTAHLMNVVPVNGSYVLPMSWQIGGVDIVDWTDTLNPLELAWFDVDTTATEAVNANGTNREAGDSALRSNAWAAYWYNGHVYASYDSPIYGSFSPAGSRGLEVFDFTGASVAGAFDLPHLNPQTQESLISCSASTKARLRVGRKTTFKVTVKALGQGVLGASVKAKTFGFSSTKVTNASGQVSFTIRPKSNKAKKLTITVAGEPNMIGCKTTKSIKRR
jgi:hypothetical protein